MWEAKKAIIEQLRKDILLAEGFKPEQSEQVRIAGLESIESAFPNGVFPTGMMHEFVSSNIEDSACCGAFITGLLASLMQKGGPCLWISRNRDMFPPSLKLFGVDPEKVVFVDLAREKDVLWATEEALKCDGLSAVVSELKEVSFAQSRRLQLAVEQSRVTGMLFRHTPEHLTTTACVSRWQISHLPGPKRNTFGLTFPRWKVELLKVRNGTPGSWNYQWRQGRFAEIIDVQQPQRQEQRKVG
jgi:protein ImuA